MRASLKTLFLLVAAFCMPIHAAQLGALYEQVADPTNKVNPSVNLSASSTVANNQTLALNAQASVCSGCRSSYYWTASGGSFSGSENSPNVTWIPPLVNSTQAYDITVTVGDGKGRIAVASHQITVSAAINACQAALSAPRLYEMGGWSEVNYLPIAWQTMNDATGYILQESTSIGFTASTSYTTTGYANASLTLSNKTSGTYYYRVMARNGCGESPWSNTTARVVKLNQPPDVPAQAVPADGATGVSRTPRLSWSGGDSDGQADYAVEVGTDPANMVFRQGYGSSNAANLSTQMNWSLSPSTIYYWRVRSRDNHGVEVIGPTWRFTTSDASADLVPVSVQMTGTLANGSTVNLRVVVENQGNYPADGGILRFYYAPIENGQSREFTGRFRGLPALAPGASTTVSVDLPLQGLTAGVSYLVAKIDTELMLSERSIANNSISYRVDYNDTRGPSIEYFDLRYPTVGSYKSGHAYTFAFSVPDDIGASSVDLAYSGNGGSSWDTVVARYPVTNSGYGNSYDWVMPATMSSTDNFKVRLTARDSSGNTSVKELGPFKVIDGSAPSVQIKTPATGETWDLGSTRTIAWSASSPNGIAEVRLSYYYDNGNSAISLATLSGNPGSYTWKLPTAAGFASTSGQIALSVRDNNGNEASIRSVNFATRDASAPPAAPWGAPAQVSNVPVIGTSDTTQGDRGAQVAIDGSGTAHMVYVYDEDNLSGALTNINSYPGRVVKQTLYYTRRSGTGWTAPVVLRAVVNNQDMTSTVGMVSIINARISVSVAGVPSVIWQEDVEGARNRSEIMFSSFNGSSWSTPFNLSANSAQAVLTWASTAVPPISPTEGGGRVRLAVLGDDIYASGFSYFRRLYRYSTTSNSWSRMADVADAISWNGLESGDMCFYNGILYAAGAEGQFVAYDPLTNSWSKKAPLPVPGAGLRLRAIGSHLYAVAAGAGSALQQYNPATDRWTTRSPMPTAREYPAVSTLGGKLQVIGGRTASGRALKTFEQYDPATDSWTQKPDTKALSGAMGGADVFNGRIYASAQDYASLEAYDPTLNIWMPVDKLPGRLGAGDLVAVRGELYAIGALSFAHGIFAGTSVAVPAISWNPRIVTDASDVVHMLWQDGCHEYNVDGQRWSMTSDDCTLRARTFKLAGAQLSAVSMPLGAYAPMNSFDYVISPGNIEHLAFVQYDSALKRETIKYVSATSGIWGTPTIAAFAYQDLVSDLNLGVGAAGAPMLIARNYQYASATERLFFTSLASGAWAAPETVVSGANNSFTPARVVIDAAGAPVVLYRQTDNMSTYLSRRLADGTWTRGTAGNTAAQYVSDFSTAVDLTRNLLYVPYTTRTNGHDEVFVNIADLNIDTVAPSITLDRLNVAQIAIAGTALQLGWNASDDRAVTSVSLQYTTDGGASYTAIASGLSTTGSYAWTLPEATAAQLQIRAIAIDAAGNQTLVTSEAFALAPKKLVALAIVGTRILQAGDAADYTVTAIYDNGSASTVAANLTLSMSSYATLSGNHLSTLMVPANQDLILDASYAEGGIAKTARMAVTVRYLAPPTVPGAPAITATVAGNGSATLLLGTPASDGGKAITGYTVVSSPPGAVDSNAGGVGLRRVMGGLRNGVAYTFTAVAHNVVGNSAPSAPSDAVIPYAALSGMARLVAGGDYSCALGRAGGVKCWGDNRSGQLGDKSVIQRAAAVNVAGLDSGVAALAAGFSHACALITSGAVKCWGANESGQLGDGTLISRSAPVGVKGLESGIVAIAAGKSHTCALSAIGAIKCWGANASGQLGDKSTIDRVAPVIVSGLSGDVVSLDAGANHTCAVSAAGMLRCWGSNSSGQLGDNTLVNRTTAVDVVGLNSGVKAVVAGGEHTCALTVANATRCWGANSGQLGDSTTTARSVPADVAGLGGGMVALAAGWQKHSCAVTAAGQALCWGNNDSGQLGDGNSVTRLMPVEAGTNLTRLPGAIAAGNSHTCALNVAGEPLCWGDNQFGQLGDSSVKGHVLAAPVANLDGALLPTMAMPVSFPGVRANYSILRVGDGFVVTDTAGSGLARPFARDQRVLFSDSAVAFDVDGEGIAGKAFRLYQAAFNRLPDKAGLGYWIAFLDGGYSLDQVAAEFIRSAEFTALYGAKPTDGDLVTAIYRNVLHRTPDQAGFDYWTNALGRGLPLHAMLSMFSDSDENRIQVSDAVWAGVSYSPYGLGQGTNTMPISLDVSAARLQTSSNVGADDAGGAVAVAAGPPSVEVTGLWSADDPLVQGLTLLTQGNLAWAAIHTLDQQGRPAWYQVRGCPLGTAACSGSLHASFDHTAPEVGSARFEVGTSADANGSLDYMANGNSGAAGLVHSQFGAGRFLPDVDLSGAWTDGAQVFALAQQFDQLSGIWYTHDNSGMQTWFTMDPCTVTEQTCIGELRSAHRISPGEPVHWRTAGRVSWSFSEGAALLRITLNGKAFPPISLTRMAGDR